MSSNLTKLLDAPPRRALCTPEVMDDRGFTLIEVLASLAIVSAAVISGAQLLTATGTTVHAARLQTCAVALATARMEELRSLAYTLDPAGAPLTDGSTNLSTDPPATGGPGLTPSPPGALEQNTSGYVDFLDAGGRWLSAGPSVPARAAFVRRWSIDQPADGSPDSLVLQVIVRPIVEDTSVNRARIIGGRGEARLITLVTRVVP
jgi:prepilin-type N-terminal cleavage/methylation domain-containing protein